MRARPKRRGIGAGPFCLPASLSLPALHMSLCRLAQGVTPRARHAWHGVLLAPLRQSITPSSPIRTHTPTRTPSHRRACTPPVTRTRTQARWARRLAQGSYASRFGPENSMGAGRVVAPQRREQPLRPSRSSRLRLTSDAICGAASVWPGGPLVFYRAGAVRGLRRPVCRNKECLKMQNLFVIEIAIWR